MSTPVERAVFGDADAEDWLDRHVRARLGAGLAAVTLRAGRVAPVFGVALDDGSAAVVKVHREPVDRERLARAVACQARLVAAGYPCPRPLDGPAATDGRVAVIEAVLERGERADAHAAPVRRVMAAALAEHVALLGVEPPAGLVAGAPAWARYEEGPWPEPHDPIFDFRVTPTQYAWLDALARRAADVLGAHAGPAVIGHSDWVCQNLRFAGGAVVAAYDWDSLVARPEAAVAGFAAGAFTEGSTAGTDAPAPAEVAGFLADYETARGRRWAAGERDAALAAATWVLAYNARCGVGFPAGDGSSLALLDRHRAAYLTAA